MSRAREGEKSSERRVRVMDVVPFEHEERRRKNKTEKKDRNFFISPPKRVELQKALKKFKMPYSRKPNGKSRKTTVL